MESMINVKCLVCTKGFPFRSNKKFCSSKCRNNYHNELLKEQMNKFNGELRKVKKAERTLKVLITKMKELGLEYITENSLKLFDIPLNGQLDAGKNPITKFTVKFFGQYGIEPIDDKALYFKIVERKK